MIENAKHPPRANWDHYTPTITWARFLEYRKREAAHRLMRIYCPPDMHRHMQCHFPRQEYEDHGVDVICMPLLIMGQRAVYAEWQFGLLNCVREIPQ